ncbi:hypothetical protein [Mesorhizobium sp. B1-1-8]|uniref:hypothetical protein n=1 Tax=Mesorhizobium sp. B1-1-8 TaxID=2589976 RepID=UPI00112ECF10|nr:hypothetical protein [Mesorhizobium sp. B1-1-8]UCI07320.1 hypothetical protein FJ974_26640 [Mesorhizobium sp. B1-1-8]
MKQRLLSFRISEDRTGVFVTVLGHENGDLPRLFGRRFGDKNAATEFLMRHLKAILAQDRSGTPRADD